MSRMKASITSPEEIINAYNKYGEDFLIIDLNNIKEYGMKTVKYFDIKIKKEDGTVVIPYIKFIKLLLASKIRAPAERDYEKLKIAIRRDDEANVDSLFGKAMELICNTFTKKVKDMKAEGIINDDEEDDNNKSNVIIVPSCKSQTPLQKRAKDKDGVTKTFDNPMLWFGLNYKTEEDKDLKKLDFSYKADVNSKFAIRKFDIDIYDTENIVNKKPQLAKVDDELINNFNIDKFVTMKSVLSGFVYMQVKASKQSFNLNTKVIKSLYVKTNKVSNYSSHLFNDDELDDIIGDSCNSESTKPTFEESKPIYKQTKEEIIDDDDDNDSVNDEINNLKFS